MTNLKVVVGESRKDLDADNVLTKRLLGGGYGGVEYSVVGGRHVVGRQVRLLLRRDAEESLHRASSTRPEVCRRECDGEVDKGYVWNEGARPRSGARW